MVASTGWLITVVPPDSLYYALNGELTTESLDVPPDAFVAPTGSSDHAAEGLDKVLAAARLKKWRKGKILPLVPDLKGMMRVIGKEWHLPSEVGMEVYLASGTRVYDRGASQRSHIEDGEMEDEMDGMLSEETWRMVWAEYISEAEGTSTRAASGNHAAQIVSPTMVDAEQAQFEVKDMPCVGFMRRGSIRGTSPTSPELPLTGNTFGSTNQPFIDVSQEISPAADSNIVPHASMGGTRHGNALTPDSSQTAFEPSSVQHSRDILSSAAQKMLSPSPSSVFPGASSSQHASPISGRASRSNSGALQRRVLGKIEFDFDSSSGGRGEWYSTWLKRKVQTRQRRVEPDTSNGLKMRPLRLATGTSRSAKSDTSEYIEDLQDEEGQAEYAPLMDEDEDEPLNRHAESPKLMSHSPNQADAELDHLVSGALAEAFPEGPDDFVNAFTTGHTGNQAEQSTYSWKDIGSHRILNDSVKLEQLAPPTATENEQDMDMTEVRQMMDTERAKAENQELLVPGNPGQLLASPIDLASPQVDNGTQPSSLLAVRSTALLEEASADGSMTVHGLGMGIDMDDDEAKRGSALVISSQLDILERGMLHSLHDQRYLTPV